MKLLTDIPKAEEYNCDQSINVLNLVWNSAETDFTAEQSWQFTNADTCDFEIHAMSNNKF